MDIQTAQLNLNKAALEWYHEHRDVHVDIWESALGRACYEFERAVRELGPAIDYCESYCPYCSCRMPCCCEEDYAVGI